MAGGEGRSATVEEINHLHAALTVMFRGAFRSPEENDPASAATDPGHGLNNPNQEKAMDSQTDTTAAGPSKGFDYETAFQSLEGSISDVLNCARVTEQLILGYDHPMPKDRIYRLSEEEYNALAFMMRATVKNIEALDERWLDHHNAGCEAQIASNIRAMGGA